MQSAPDATLLEEPGHPVRTARPSSGFRKAVDGIESVSKAVLAFALLAELLVVLTDITGRFFFNHSLLWSQEASQLALATIAFIGGAIAYRSGHHIMVQVITNTLAPAAREFVAIGVNVAIMIVALLIGYALYDLILINMESQMPMLQISAAWIDVPAGIGMALLVLFCVEKLVYDFPRRKVWMTVAAGIVVTALITAMNLYQVFSLGSDASLSVMLLCFLVTVLIGVPVGFSMLLCTIVYLAIGASVPMVAVPQNMVDGTGNFILLALPFFIFVGMIMEKGGISMRLVSFAMTLVGHLRGGILQVIVVTMYLVAGISGSKTADVAAVGSVMRRELETRGYKPEEGAAVISSAAAMSETIPPSIGMLVLGSVTPISIGTLFLAGIIPAAVLAVCLMVLIFLRAGRNGAGRAKRATLREIAASAVGAIPALLMPAIMVVGIKAGVATPTEVSAVAVFYGLVLAICIYRAVSLKEFYKIVVESTVMSGMVLFIIAAAFSFSWGLSAAYLPQHLVALLSGTGRTTFLLESIVFLIVIGSLLEGLPALIILGPLLLPIANQLGVGSIHYAILLLLSMGVGIFMPPIGVGFYVSNAVVGARVEPAAKAVIPFLAVLVIGILLVAFVPWFTDALPNLVDSLK